MGWLKFTLWIDDVETDQEKIRCAVTFSFLGIHVEISWIFSLFHFLYCFVFSSSFRMLLSINVFIQVTTVNVGKDDCLPNCFPNKITLLGAAFLISKSVENENFFIYRFKNTFFSRSFSTLQCNL